MSETQAKVVRDADAACQEVMASTPPGHVYPVIAETQAPLASAPTPDQGPCPHCGGHGLRERLGRGLTHDTATELGYCSCAVGRQMARDEVRWLQKRREQNVGID